MESIKTEILEICEAFNLGSFIEVIGSYHSNCKGYILTKFKTSQGVFNHYSRV